jgi:hypothetical protein
VNERWVGVAAVAVLMGACSGAPSSPGTVTGALPLCYGPGPDTNLWPRSTIETYRSGKLVSTQTFLTSREHRTYTLTLRPGRYELQMLDRRYRIWIDVRSRKETHADWPQPGCL